MSISMHKPNIHKATSRAFSATVDEDLGQMITQALHILFFCFYFFSHLFPLSSLIFFIFFLPFPLFHFCLGTAGPGL